MMKKRKYTNIKAVEAQIISMRESGMTRQEIADALGLEKSQIKNWIFRHNKKQKSEKTPAFELNEGGYFHTYFLICASAAFSSRETCAWEMPISSATSICVFP